MVLRKLHGVLTLGQLDHLGLLRDLSAPCSAGSEADLDLVA